MWLADRLVKLLVRGAVMILYYAHLIARPMRLGFH